MPRIDYRAARALLPLADVLGLLGFRPCQRHGPQLRGPRPVQRSRSATRGSFAAHLGKNAWYCCRGDAGGNALDLWATVTRQPLPAAVLDLCQRLGREVPWLPPSPRGPRTPAREPSLPEP
jgi:hypothetical protein